MWQSRRDCQGVWEGWNAGFLVFLTLSFLWPALEKRNLEFTVIAKASSENRNHFSE
jgi:hypothetical protein